MKKFPFFTSLIPSVVFGVVVGSLAWNEWLIRSHGVESPTEVALADWQPAAGNENAHVTLTRVGFGKEFSVVEWDARGRWQTVWIPLVVNGQLRAMVRTNRVGDHNDLIDFERRTSLSGVARVDGMINQPESWQSDDLRQAYPGTPWDALPILMDDRPFPSLAFACTLTGIAAVALAWPVAFFTFKAWWQRTTRLASMEAIRSGSLFEAQGPLPDGIGEFQQGFERDADLMVGFFIVSYFVLALACAGAFGLVHPRLGIPTLVLHFMSLVGFGLSWLLVQGIVHRHDFAATFTNGMIARYGATTTACLWEEVESAKGLVRVWGRGGFPLFLGGPIELSLSGGMVVKVLAVKNEEELVRAIRDNASPHLLDRAVEQIRSGATITAGRLTVERSGITGPRKAWIPWSDIDRVVVSSKKAQILLYSVHSAKPWWRGDLATPDGALLLDLTSLAARVEVD